MITATISSSPSSTTTSSTMLNIWMPETVRHEYGNQPLCLSDHNNTYRIYTAGNDITAMFWLVHTIPQIAVPLCISYAELIGWCLCRHIYISLNKGIWMWFCICCSAVNDWISFWICLNSFCERLLCAQLFCMLLTSTHFTLNKAG